MSSNWKMSTEQKEKSPMSTAQISTIETKIKPCTKQFHYAIIALVLMSVCPLRSLAQEGHSHALTAEHQELTPGQKTNASALLQIVRESTARFKDVSAAEAEGYALQFGCVTGDSAGAMGLHFINGDLVNKGVLDVTHPQIVIYEPTPKGGLRLIGADYLLFQAAWDANHSAPPQLMGQAFHLFDAPNQFGLPAFYTLHVWAWKDNPNGAFVNWHPNVSCEAFTPRNP
jgi:hypothetical protein